MEKLRSTFELSFSTKVIVPVVALMVMLMATTVWLLDHRVTQQFQLEATRSLAAAHSFFAGARGRTPRNCYCVTVTCRRSRGIARYFKKQTRRLCRRCLRPIS